MYEEMARKVNDAADNRNKAAMIHLQILLNANHLHGVRAEMIGESVGLDQVWATEIRKMLSVSRLMAEEGLSIAAI